jgi:hypothetical protein
MAKLGSVMKLTDEATCSVIRGATGRKTDFLNNAHYEQEKSVKEWVACENEKGFLTHPAANKFRDLISAVQAVGQKEITCYRGRYKSSNMVPRPMPSHFGPPPKEKAEENRYNVAGKPVLYLASTREGVAYELRKDQQPIIDLLCQEYVVKIENIRLSDFSEPSLDNFIHITFDYAEHGMRSGRINKEDYVFSQVVANIVECQGYSGMIVPGVRGVRGHRYNNIVIFNPEDSWRLWVNDGKEPECIDNVLQTT